MVNEELAKCEATKDQTPLHRACFENRIDMARVLLEIGGANPNICDYFGNTPLHFAGMRENTELVKLLQRFGATNEPVLMPNWTLVKRIALNNWLTDPENKNTWAEIITGQRQYNGEQAIDLDGLLNLTEKVYVNMKNVVDKINDFLTENMI